MLNTESHPTLLKTSNFIRGTVTLISINIINVMVVFVVVSQE